MILNANIMNIFHSTYRIHISCNQLNKKSNANVHIRWNRFDLLSYGLWIMNMRHWKAKMMEKPSFWWLPEWLCHFQRSLFLRNNIWWHRPSPTILNVNRNVTHKTADIKISARHIAWSWLSINSVKPQCYYKLTVDFICKWGTLKQILNGKPKKPFEMWF